MQGLVCSLCGNSEFHEHKVLWPELVSEWQLTQHEHAYVDRQQGCACTTCGANLRVIALANAIRTFVGTDLPLRQAVAAGMLAHLRILDCNGAEGISTTLAPVPSYKRADYPEYDMQALPFADGSFDLILHSDTLEHIEFPIVALQECRRILSAGGRICYTVPIIHGRLTRNRAGLAPSYHGTAEDNRTDYLVHTEFGADAWTYVLEAGFNGVSFNHVDFPSALAISAWMETPVKVAVQEQPHLHEAEAEAAAQETPHAVEILTPAQPAMPSLESVYDQDGLRSIHNHEFMQEAAFQAAYNRGVQAVGTDYHWHWRVHTGLWAASLAAKLPGDFAEFGVNRGFLSSAIMQHLDWNNTGRRFYLLDTFEGIDERYINDDDIEIGVLERNKRDIERGFYTFDLDAVRANFAEWPNALIIAGPVPDTLIQIDSQSFAFAHIDMNCAPPEVAAAEFLWPRFVPGAVMLLDDYAYSGYRSQKLAMDAFAKSKNVPILSLPTGQGLIIKPAHS